MTKGYENFDLYLEWQREGISVECHCDALGEFPALKTRSSPKPLSVSIPTTTAQFNTLKDEGEKIACVLLPKGPIRDQFRKWWNAEIKIRLRLIYPHPDIQEEKHRVEQIKEISRHPWEYVYLTKNDDDADKPRPEYLLGIREEISIVHCLRKPESANAIGVRRLPFTIRYISHLAGVEQSEVDIFNEFMREIRVLEEIVKYQPIGEPSELNVVKGFMEDDLVHITSHGDSVGLTIEPDEPFTQFEALTAFNHTTNPQVKGVILLSCSNKLGSGGLAAWLHLHTSVPVVIGMTGTIFPDPAAKNFVRGFYRGLRRPSEGLERAVFLGRLSMYKQDGFLSGEPLDESIWDPGFGLPRLYLNGPDSVLVPEDLLFGSLERMVSGFDNIINEADCSPEINENLPTLSNWIEKKKNAWFLVTGPEGSGKSRLMACLVHQLTKKKEETPQSPPIIYHFCQIEDTKTSDPLDFIRHSLAPQLVKHYGEDYKKEIPEGSFPLRVGNEREAIRAFVIEPLSKLKRKIEKPVIIIDGIDVIDPNYSILDLLVDNRGDLEDIARLIITANTVEVGAPGSEDIRNAQKIMDNILWLTHHHHDGQSDLTIKVSKDPRILFSKMEESLAPLLSEKSPIKAWGELNNLFDQAIETAQRKHEEFDWWKEKVTRLLEVVTVACEPLPADSVAVIIGLEASGDEMKQLQSVLQPFFKNYENYQNSFFFFHSSLKTHLLNRIGRQPQQSLANVHGLFVQAFRPQSGDWTEITDWKSLTGTKWQGMFTDKSKGQASISHYVQRYLSHHAYYSYYYTPSNDPLKRRDRAKDFLNLTCDPGFRTVHLDEVGREAAVQDLWNGLRVVYTEYLHNLSPQDNNDQARLALDRLLAANEPGSSGSNELIKLEQRLRNDPKAGWKDLFEFLDLDIGW